MNDAPKQMSCMEVWGGNQAMDGGVIMAGLDAWIYSRPWRDELAGGDVHYVSSCASGRITRLVVADVSGHGASVADLAAELRQRMRRFVNHLDQRRFVKTLNSEFTKLSDAGTFATAIIGTYFAPNRFLSLVNAGHPPPLYYSRRECIWTLLEDTTEDASVANVPLGISEDMRYHEIGLTLDVGDLLLFYSDSLLEMGESPLEPAQLLPIVEQVDVDQPEEMIHELVRAASGGAESDDDMTVLLVRPNGMTPQFSLRERLRAPAIMFRRLLRGEAGPWPDLKLANVGGALVPYLNRFWGRKKGTIRRIDTDES